MSHVRPTSQSFVLLHLASLHCPSLSTTAITAITATTAISQTTNPKSNPKPYHPTLDSNTNNKGAITKTIHHTQDHQSFDPTKLNPTQPSLQDPRARQTSKRQTKNVHLHTPPPRKLHLRASLHGRIRNLQPRDSQWGDLRQTGKTE